ncbi:carbohydrate ABC transporter permease [Herbiconiux ginsengi]|uniref:Multiple sugar transport system permease protein n=1 Tax=Herbiconiux ginsengi TaxID=381665 RepID=A0A1H3LHC9_9MICO|nr:sugar ABC transporter permease [Herbiconiux ginsengi]SDY63937.1 multiple sugar transport system permease protein [Herbiconiux ginsengi]
MTTSNDLVVEATAAASTTGSGPHDDGRVLEPRARRRLKHPGRWRRDLSALVLLLPALLLFGVFSWWPILRSLLLSVQYNNLVDAPTWVGLDNFANVFSDPILLTAVRNTLEFGALSVLFGFPIPLFLAIMMFELRRLGGIFRVLVYIPVIIPPVVSVLLWKFFYDPDNGLFNAALGAIGLGPFPWLQSTATALPSLVLLILWAGVGSTVLLFLAALSGVSPELYEAAETDGASIWQRIWHVTLPQLRGIMLILLLLQMIGTLQIFTEPYVMTDGGPENSTVTVLLLIYRAAFINGDFGYATALSVLLAAALAILSAIYLRLTRAWSTS